MFNIINYSSSFKYHFWHRRKIRIKQYYLGSILNCITTSTPGVAFSNAKVNFVVSGVKSTDSIAVYQYQNGSWVQLTVTEVRDGHVVVNMTQNGDILFVKVPMPTVVVG